MKIVFATNNKNKIKEVKSLIPNHITLLSLEDIGCFEDIPETSNSIEGNAVQKANYIKDNYSYNCFADDTGLEVEALDGNPGVDTAHYAGFHRNNEDNINKLLANLEMATTRDAQFKTVIAMCLNEQLITFTGICKGEITTKKQGHKGFGYDSVFKAKGHNKTFSQISLEEKNKISHRGKAVALLIKYLNTTLE